MRWTIAWPLLLTACASYDSIEEACKEKVPGAEDAPDGALAVFQRLTCYRRYAGLGQARLSPPISRAVANHVFYLNQNVTTYDLATVPALSEESGQAGYTGATPIDRFELEGFTSENQSIQTWSVFAYFTPEQAPREYIDSLIHDPLFRDALLAPGWRAGSWSRGELLDELPFGYLEAALYLPSQQNAYSPVSYPVDGQVNVPTEWENPYAYLNNYQNVTVPPPFDRLDEIVGYPVTFTFGSAETSGSFNANPLQVQLRSSSFVGPSGPVEHAVIFPGTYFGGVNMSTLALVPLQPLEPNATYTVDIDVAWISRDRMTRQYTFTTSSVAGPGFQ